MSTSLLEAIRADAVSSPTPRSAQVKVRRFENDQIAAGLDFGLATDRDVLEQAFRLQHDQYVGQGYMDPHPSGWRLSTHYALPSTRVFVARSGHRVVATMTLIGDSPLGLPMDEIYADDLRGLRGQRRDLAEVSGLALDPNYSSSGVAILLRLIRMMALYAVRVAHLSDLCIAVNPHHAVFYRKAFYFQDIGGLKQYGKVNGAPAVALRLDLGPVPTVMSALRDGQAVRSEIYSFLFRPENVEPVMARLVEDLAQASPRGESLVYFFSRHEAWAKSSLTERAYLLARCHALIALECPMRRLATPEPADAQESGGLLTLAVA